MKAVICRSIRDEPDLIVGEFARPELKPGTMIIRAFAGGLNFADSLAVKDERYPRDLPWQRDLGSKLRVARGLGRGCD